jgi:RecA/RadA recombinase
MAFAISAHDLLLKRRPMLSIGDAKLDSLLRGGFPCQGITEVSGEAGAGKTQFCLTLCLQCHVEEAYGGLHGNAVYLSCGEGLFPQRRLEELALQLSNKYLALSPQNPYYEKEKFMDDVFIQEFHTLESVLEVLTNDVPKMCNKKNTKLVIVDSIAGIARTEFKQDSSMNSSSTNTNMKRSFSESQQIRLNTLHQIALRLKWVADTFSVCVIVVNQVSASGFREQNQAVWSGIDMDIAPSYSGFKDGTIFYPKTFSVTPSLGLFWSNMINTRILLERDSTNIRHTSIETMIIEKENDHDGNGSVVSDSTYKCPPSTHAVAPVPGSGVHQISPILGVTGNAINRHNEVQASKIQVMKSKRTFHIVFSARVPSASCPYEIAADGVHGL